ncbi:hypothetical protein [Candidatus Entotheonella palauensis]|uniref:hypothetical protein n=1 Tax=Candidatus Entotheonella palauensis TaxID=93172 RepID=UPI000B7D7A0F|nr:hypothetical protein [Candidatus Entotheonella palauensis]
MPVTAVLIARPLPIDTGLELVPSLPDASARADHELELLLALRHALVATRGYMGSEIAEVLTRMQALCEQKEESPHLVAVLRGQVTDHMMRAEFPLAHAAAEQKLRLIQGQNDPAQLAVAHYDLGCMLYWGGTFTPAREHLEQALSLRRAHVLDPRRTDTFMVNHDVMCRAWLSWICAFLGDHDQALTYSRDSVKIAQELRHPYTLVQALAFASSFHLRRREVQAANELLNRMLALANEEGFSYFAVTARNLQAWGLILQGHSDDGIALMRQSQAILQKMANLGRTALTLQIAEGYRQSGQANEGLAVIQEVQEMIARTGERFYEAELYRLQGELHLIETSCQEADIARCFQKALDTARQQRAKMFALRAAMSLCRLWQRQGRHDVAHRLLAEVYQEFTEGFDIPDMQEAKGQLAELETG